MIFVGFAFGVSSTEEIYNGILAILKSPDLLVSDYIEIGGLGAALINSSVVGIATILLLAAVKYNPSGQAIFVIWLNAGFAFFGKNLLNMSPILLGGYLYSRFMRQPFSHNVLGTIMGTALAPAVTQLVQMDIGNPLLAWILGNLLGVGIGFVIDPIAKSTVKAHGGFNLYNSGFATGVIGIIIMSIFRNYGYGFDPVSIWSSGNNYILEIYILVISLTLLVIGLIYCRDWQSAFKEMIKLPRGHRDYYAHGGEATYINMGVLGIFCGILLYFMDVEISGPTLGGVFTIIGFGGYSKNILNITPILVGAILAVISSTQSFHNSTIVVAILFSTCLSPIASAYGWKWGVVAGFLHLHMSVNIGPINGGLNLYNNGLAGGLVAMVLVPVIEMVEGWISKRKKKAKVHTLFDDDYD